MEFKGENQAMLRGQVVEAPQFSHTNHGVDYYKVPFRVPRLSGAEDVVNLLVAHPPQYLWSQGQWLEVEGEMRSYNNRSGQGSRLVITMLVRQALPAHCEQGENHLMLCGVVCKPPVYRHTPLGREICDLLVAVNRPYGRADYLPCIAWGSVASRCANLPVGTHLCIEGRLQSREYLKTVEGERVTRTAYEISIMTLSIPEGE